MDNRNINEVVKKAANKRNRKRIVSLLAILVLITTTNRLVFPASTMSKDEPGGAIYADEIAAAEEDFMLPSDDDEAAMLPADDDEAAVLPSDDDEKAANSADDEAAEFPEEIAVEASDVEAPVEEVTFELSDVEGDLYDAADYTAIEAENSPVSSANLGDFVDDAILLAQAEGDTWHVVPGELYILRLRFSEREGLSFDAQELHYTLPDGVTAVAENGETNDVYGVYEVEDGKHLTACCVFDGERAFSLDLPVSFDKACWMSFGDDVGRDVVFVENDLADEQNRTEEEPSGEAEEEIPVETETTLTETDEDLGAETAEEDQIVEAPSADEAMPIVVDSEQRDEAEQTDAEATDDEAAEAQTAEKQDEAVTADIEVAEEPKIEKPDEAEAADVETDPEQSSSDEAENQHDADEAENPPAADESDEGQPVDHEREKENIIIDLAEVESYPLSMRALIGDAIMDVESPDREDGLSDDTEMPAEEMTVALAVSPITFDEALLSVEAVDDDYLVMPIANFDSTTIGIGIHTVTLLNGRVVVEYPAQSFEGSTEYVTVSVSADEGAFPAGTTMKLADIDDEGIIDGITDKAEEDFVRVERVHAVDITFLNAGGDEIEPLIPISVVMTVKEIEDNRDAVVVHVDDEGEARLVEEVAQTEADSSLEFVADSFSVYAVVVTQKIETKVIAADGNAYRVEVAYAEDAGIPSGARLSVSEVTGDGNYLDLVKENIDGQIMLARFFDIKIMDGGEEVSIEAPVQVKVWLDEEVSEAAAPMAVHFAEEGVETLEADDADDGVTFKADGFSVWGVVYTVDFHYDVDGQSYEFNLDGGRYVSLQSLVEALGAEVDFDSAADFMREVEAVTFSAPELLWVGRVDGDTTVGALKAELGLEPEYSAGLTDEDIDDINAQIIHAGDWGLISLRPFATEQTLTITMKNGDVFVIAVTDAQHVTDLTKVINNVKLYEDGKQIDWPAVVRENKYYDLRLSFQEEDAFQFIDTDEWMTYPLPEGIDIGDVNFDRTFTMDLGDGVKLEGNILHYDATLRMFFIKWNTEDTTGFNKLKSSASAEFRIDLQVKFTFNPDELHFGNDITERVILDTSSDIEINKTGVYDKDNDKVDYTVTVTSYGNSSDVTVEDRLFGTALTYISEGGTQGVTWETDYELENNSIGNVELTYPDPEHYPSDEGRDTSVPNGFKLNIGEMRDGETITFHYSADVDYDKLNSGSGDYEETFNKVTAENDGVTKEAEHSFEGEMRYVELEKTRAAVNWGDADTTTVNWTVRVNHDPKVGLAGTAVTDRIYAGDVESMDYSGDGLHVMVYDKKGLFVGEYDVSWESVDTMEGLEPSSGVAYRNPVRYNAVKDEYEYASWKYILPETVTAKNGDATVTIDNTQKYYYDFTYTTLADKTKMIFDGYVGNEAEEDKTGNLMQGGLYPPGTGTTPEVHKYVDTEHAPTNAQPKGSNEKYIYWVIEFERQSYDLTRSVIEDNNPQLWGRKEGVDNSLRTEAKEESVVHSDDDGSKYQWLWVEGLTADESWEVAEGTDARTSIKFYQDQDKKKPGLLSRSNAAAAGSGSNTIRIHLRTLNNSEWIDGTMTRYWPRDHVNTVNWIANAHIVSAEAAATPDVRKIEKVGTQVGTVMDNGVSLPVFRFELYLTGVSEDDFKDGKDLVITDTFDTGHLAFVDVSAFTANNNTAEGVTEKKTLSIEEMRELNVNWWDQAMKGYSKTNKWVGPVKATVADADGKSGVTFTITEADFKARGYEPDSEGEYCLRYSLPYYLMVKDADAAQALAQLPQGESENGLLTKNGDIVKFKNTARWGGTSLTCETQANADFKPVTKEMTYDPNTDTATYTIVINPQRLRLNNGELIRVEDSYQNLAVDFSTVAEGITTYPEEKRAMVDWAYHNNVGTFWIPDETMVTITYKAQPIGDPGKKVTVTNTVRLLDFAPVENKHEVQLSSESEGSAGDYNIRLFKYQDNSMNLPLEGAIFQLFEEDASGNKVAMTYQSPWSDADDEDGKINRELGYHREDGSDYPTEKNHAAGDDIYFTTHANGFADIHLRQDRDGLALKRGKQYYLQEIQTPNGFSGEMSGGEPLFWSFIIDDMDYFDSASHVYVYRDNGVMTVSNTSQDAGIVLRKDFKGDPLSWDDQKNIEFEIVGTIKDTDTVVYRKTVTYADFVKDSSDGATQSGYRLKIRLEELPHAQDKTYVYTVTEKKADVVTHTRETTVSTKIGTDEASEKAAADAATVEITPEDFSRGTAFRFYFENDYTAKPVDLSVSKAWGAEAEKKYDRQVSFELVREGLAPGEDAAGSEELVLALYWDETDSNYKPYYDYTSEAWSAETGYRIADGAQGKTPVTSFALNGSETKAWSVDIAGLPRYDQKGNAYAYSVRETAVRYRDTEGGTVQEATGEDIDARFTITATDQDGATVSMKNTREAVFDLDHRESGALTFTNEIATLIDVTVDKAWPAGEDHSGESITYDLYRTTAELPVGGKDRDTYTLLVVDNVSQDKETKEIIGTSEVTLKEPTVDFVIGDYLDITVKSNQPASNGKWKFDLAGMIYYYLWNGYQQVTGIYAHAFPVQKVMDKSGKDITDDFDDYLNNNDETAQRVYNGAYPEQTIVVRVLVDQLTGMDTSKNGNTNPIAFRCWYPFACEISVENYSQNQENLKHATLEELASRSETTLVRSGMTLEELQSWTASTQFPRDDGQGTNFTYFVLENPVPAGYDDEYKVEIDLDEDTPEDSTRAHTIHINNKKKEDPPEGQTTSLTITKQVTFDPADHATDAAKNKTYYVTLANGSKYVVRTGENTFALKTPGQISTHNAAAGESEQWSPYLEITTDEPIVVTGIPEGKYTLAEVVDAAHPVDIEGYTLTTTYDNPVVNLTAGKPLSRTITNTYAPIPPEQTSFSFSKLWIGQSDTVPVVWPEDTSIHLNFRRRANGAADEDFDVGFTVKSVVDLVTLTRGWEISDPTGKWDALLTPTLIPADPGRYYNYALTLNGVREADDDGNQYEYYVTEAVPANAEYRGYYGTLSGTAANIVDDKEYAGQGEAVINQFEQASVSFTKNWVGQNRDALLTNWPEQEVLKDPESDEGAEPVDSPEMEPVPMSILLGRRLRYTDHSGKEHLSALDPTYSAGFNNLTGSRKYLESHPEEGKLTLQMTQDGADFNYTISGLKKFGAMEIDGETVEGEWVYYVFEDIINGYCAAFYDKDGELLSGEFSVPTEGKIVNTQLLGTLALKKAVSGVDLKEDKTYSFAVQRKSSSGGSDMFLLTDGTLVGASTPHVHTLTVPAGKQEGWIYFYDVIPGNYDIVELGTGEDGSAQITGYALTVTPAREEGEGAEKKLVTAQTQTVEINRTLLVTFTNTYELVKTKAQFQKVWMSQAGETVAWPDGESISVTLRRRAKDRAGAGYTEDDAFELIYTGTKQGNSVVWTAGESTGVETDEDQVSISVVGDHVYNILFENLTKYVLEGDNAGQPWIYYLTEEDRARTNYAKHYGTAIVSSGNTTVTIDDEATLAEGTEVDAEGQPVNRQVHESAVINREEYAQAQITKVWQDENGDAVEWPRDASGRDIPIVITATGTKAGETDDVRTFTLTTAQPGSEDQYTYVKNGDGYTFTLYRLKLGYAYTFEEKNVPGYVTQYVDSESSSIEAGGTIKNQEEITETTTVTVTKSWDSNHYWDWMVFRIYMAVKMTDETRAIVNIRPEFYDESGNPAVAPDNTWVGNGPIYLLSTDGRTVNTSKWMSLTNSIDPTKNIESTPWIFNASDWKSYRYRFSSENGSIKEGDKTYRFIPGEDSWLTFGRENNIIVKLTRTNINTTLDKDGKLDAAPRGIYDSLPDNAVPTNKTISFGYSNNAANNTKSIDLPSFVKINGEQYPVTYYVVEEKVKVKPEYKDFTVSYAHTGNDWTVTNTPTFTDIEFTKEWCDAGSNTKATAWPVDDAEAELPITVEVTRRLKYQENGVDKYSAEQDRKAFSLTYQVTKSSVSLTQVNGSAATAAQREQYKLAPIDDTTFRFKLSGLENVGTIAVGSANKTGTWAYSVSETASPEGYQAVDASGAKLIAGIAKVPAGGTIRNAQKPAEQKLAVTKNLVHGEGHWPDEGFTFGISYAGYTAPGAETVTSPEDSAGLLGMPDETTVSVKADTQNYRGVFDAIAFYRPGEYAFTITEVEPVGAENHVKDDILYDDADHPVTVRVVSEDGALKVSEVKYGELNSLTVTNTYIGVTDFAFTKAWLPENAILPTSAFETWPEETPITVEITRMAGGVADDGFKLVYTLGADGATLDEAASVIPSGEIREYSMGVVSERGKYTFSLEPVLKGADEGHNMYTYYVSETGVPSGYEVKYGVTGVDGEVKDKADAIDKAQTDGVIINRPVTNEGYALPSTGGPGTTVYTGLGALLTLLAVALLVARKRKI